MQSIMRSNLDGTNIATILDQSLTQPGKMHSLQSCLHEKDVCYKIYSEFHNCYCYEQKE